MAKPAMDALQFLKMLKKNSPDVLFYTSHQVPKGKCYVFTHAKGTDDAIKMFKHDEGEYIGHPFIVVMGLACIGSVTLAEYAVKSFHWIVQNVYLEDDH